MFIVENLKYTEKQKAENTTQNLITQYFIVIYPSFYIHFKIPYYWTLILFIIFININAGIYINLWVYFLYNVNNKC